MSIASAISYFKAEWERRIGPKSEFSSNLTPETRNFRRLLSDAPCEAVATILNGVVAEQPSVSATTLPSPPCGRQNDRRSLAIAICCMGAAIAGVLEFLFAACAKIACDGDCAAHAHLSVFGMVALILVSLVSAVAGMRFMRRLYRQPITNDGLQSAKNQSADIIVSQGAIDGAVSIFYKTMEEVAAYVKEKEDDRALGFDISDSKSFGEWVQKFVDYANENPQNSDVAILKGDLLSKLRTMGITVYDVIRHCKNGEIQLPERDSYRDERIDENAEYSVVKHAVVISRRGVLAIGEIQ